MNKKFIITESDRNQIKKLYNITEIDSAKALEALIKLVDKSDASLMSTDTTSSTETEVSNIKKPEGYKPKFKNKFNVDLEGGNEGHKKRAFGNWESDNAWDLFAPAGTKVESITKGIVTKIKNYGQKRSKVYGTGISIKGTDEYPNIFYTHLKNVNLTVGQTIDVGDIIGEISEWEGHPSDIEHVHIGLPWNLELRDYIS